MVLDATGRANDHMGAPMQLAELERVALATIDGQHMEIAEVAGVGLESLGHLDGQLAGRRQHQHLRRAHRQINVRQKGQRKGSRLAGSGLGQAQDVPACQQRRNAGRLNRQRGFITQLDDGFDKGSSQFQLAETLNRFGHQYSPE